MSYEIINSSPDFCFIPFGTGNLYENILNIVKKEVSTKNHDPRFKGKVSTFAHLLEENFLDQALKMAESQGIHCEPSGIAGLALFLQLKEQVPKNAKILIVNTGKTKMQ